MPANAVEMGRPGLAKPLEPSVGENGFEAAAVGCAPLALDKSESFQVTLPLVTEFENYRVFNPGDYNLAALNILLDQVVAWSTALAPLRAAALVA
jgi:hypothetical protein